MRLVPDERSFHVVSKCHQFFVPTLTRSIFLLDMRELRQRVMSIEGLKSCAKVKATGHGRIPKEALPIIVEAHGSRHCGGGRPQ